MRTTNRSNAKLKAALLFCILLLVAWLILGGAFYSFSNSALVVKTSCPSTVLDIHTVGKGSGSKEVYAKAVSEGDCLNDISVEEQFKCDSFCTQSACQVLDTRIAAKYVMTTECTNRGESVHCISFCSQKVQCICKPFSSPVSKPVEPSGGGGLA